MLLGEGEALLEHHNSGGATSRELPKSIIAHLDCLKKREANKPYLCLIGTTVDFLWVIANIFITPRIVDNCHLDVWAGRNGPHDITSVAIDVCEAPDTVSTENAICSYRISVAMDISSPTESLELGADAEPASSLRP